MPEPISYTLRFPAPQTHYVEVEAVVPTEGRPEVELMMAVWTPGSYMVREFARHVEAPDGGDRRGEPLPVAKTRKNRWRIETRPRATARSHRPLPGLLARDVGADQLRGRRLRHPQRRAHLPDARRRRAAAARRAAGPPAAVEGRGQPAAATSRRGADTEHRFRAEDFDALVDSPLYAGNAPVYRFEVAGRPHLLVNEGEDDDLGRPALGRGRRADRPRAGRLLGRAPLPRYVFFNLITESGGGLEHRDSSRADDQPLEVAHPPRATATGSPWSATSSSTPGTSSACARPSSAPSTTSARSIPAASGSSRG